MGSICASVLRTGLVDAGLLMGGGAAPAAPAMVVAVAAARPDAGVQCQWYSVPAMTRLDVGLFGDAAVLLRHTGEPVPLDGSGLTAEPLQHGAVYYVLVIKTCLPFSPYPSARS